MSYYLPYSFIRASKNKAHRRTGKGGKSPPLKFSYIWIEFYSFQRDFCTNCIMRASWGLCVKGKTEHSHFTDEHVEAPKAYVLRQSTHTTEGGYQHKSRTQIWLLAQCFSREDQNTCFEAVLLESSILLRSESKQGGNAVEREDIWESGGPVVKLNHAYQWYLLGHGTYNDRAPVWVWLLAHLHPPPQVSIRPARESNPMDK